MLGCSKTTCHYGDSLAEIMTCSKHDTMIKTCDQLICISSLIVSQEKTKVGQQPPPFDIRCHVCQMNFGCRTLSNVLRCNIVSVLRIAHWRLYNNDHHPLCSSAFSHILGCFCFIHKSHHTLLITTCFLHSAPTVLQDDSLKKVSIF